MSSPDKPIEEIVAEAEVAVAKPTVSVPAKSPVEQARKLLEEDQRQRVEGFGEWLREGQAKFRCRLTAEVLLTEHGNVPRIGIIAE